MVWFERQRIGLGVLSIILALLLVGIVSVRAASPTVTVIPVNTTDDELNNDGDCSLREAIRAANTDTAVDGCPAGSGVDTITVPAGVYKLSVAGTNEDAGATGDLDITAGVVINGAGVGKTIIDGDGLDRVFEVIGPPSGSFAVIISGMTVRNGHAVDPPHGGGIEIAGNVQVTLRNIEFADNRSDGGGGAIDISDYATVTLMNAILRDNRAELSGGGVFHGGNTLIIQNSAIQGNFALRDGGGVLVTVYAVTQIFNSTISGNFAKAVTFQEGGGGLRSTGGTVTLTNSTISGNTTNGHGGGIYNSNVIGVQGTITLINVTVANNTSDVDQNGYGAGGGIYNDPDTAGAPKKSVVRMKNTLIAGNTDPNGNPDCWGTLSSLGYNLIQTVSGQCTIVGSTTGNITGQDPKLLPLADNGGNTRTHALQSTSPAIDAGTNNGCPPTDQRGVARKDGDGDNTVTCDIGAYEYDPGGAAPTHGYFFLPSVLKGA